MPIPESVKKLYESVAHGKAGSFDQLPHRLRAAMVDHIENNRLARTRSIPGRWTILRLVESDEEREQWERRWSEAGPALLKNLEDEFGGREIEIKNSLRVNLILFTREQIEQKDPLPGNLSLASLKGASPVSVLAAQDELILPEKLRTIRFTSDPDQADLFIDQKQVGTTPCTVEIPDSSFLLILDRPGYLRHTASIETGQLPELIRSGCHVTLEKAPETRMLELLAYPPGTGVTINGETRIASAGLPIKWKQPLGTTEIRFEAPHYVTETQTVEITGGEDDRPLKIFQRLLYNGSDKDEIYGHIQIFYTDEAEAGSAARPSEEEPSDGSATLSQWMQASAGEEAASAAPEPPRTPKSQHPLRRGIYLFGRLHPDEPVKPTVRLQDDFNTVSRGCHAWLWVYEDSSTDAPFNAFRLGRGGAAPVIVNGRPITSPVLLNDGDEIDIGNFRLRFTINPIGPQVIFDEF